MARELAPGCLSSTGIYTLVLPKHFVAIRAHACDSCRLLNSVDLRNTMIEEIPEFTFPTALAFGKSSYRQPSIQSELKPL